MSQAFMTYEQQIDKLINEKQLTITDREYATKMLEKISYYSLIGGYKSMFLQPATKKYKYGVTFEEIVSFYNFDEKLRNLFFKYILQVERQLKSMISYYFSEKYGESQEAYLDPKHFNYVNHKNDVNKLISTLKDIVTLPSEHTYIKYHIDKYGNVPLWVTVNAMTIGQVSAIYQFMTQDIQAKISKEYANLKEGQLNQVIKTATKCRNVCAHGERLYNFRKMGNFPDTTVHEKLHIKKKNGKEYIFGKHDLFAVVIALKYLTEEDEFREFINLLDLLVKNTLKECPHITEGQLLKEMGFPVNWAEIAEISVAE